MTTNALHTPNRMRTIAECARMLLEADPGTAITKNAIRTKVLTGEIPSVQVGRKRLINYDMFLEVISNPSTQPPVQADYGTIRRVI